MANTVRARILNTYGVGMLKSNWEVELFGIGMLFYFQTVVIPNNCNSNGRYLGFLLFWDGFGLNGTPYTNTALQVMD